MFTDSSNFAAKLLSLFMKRNVLRTCCSLYGVKTCFNVHWCFAVWNKLIQDNLFSSYTNSLAIFFLGRNSLRIKVCFFNNFVKQNMSIQSVRLSTKLKQYMETYLYVLDFILRFLLTVEIHRNRLNRMGESQQARIKGHSLMRPVFSSKCLKQLETREKMTSYLVLINRTIFCR